MNKRQQITTMEPEIEKIEVLYAAAFQVPVGDGSFTEVIMSGIYEDQGVTYAQATVESDGRALPSLIRLCQEIEFQKGLSWRLLKFSKDGIKELDKELYKEYTDTVPVWRAGSGL